MKIYRADKNEIQKALINGNLTVAVYGLGKMGLPLAAVFAEMGAKVIGADIDKKVVDAINEGLCHIEGEPELVELVEKNVKRKRLSATADLITAAKKSDVMVIIVPTFLDENNNPDLSIISSVCNNISQGLKKGDLVIVESTVPPRTTRDILLPILLESGLHEGDFGLAFCPERTSSGRAILDITGAYPKVVGGIDKESTMAAEAVYSIINAKGVISVSDATTAEAVKVFEGLYRDVNIALANELSLVCAELDISAIEVFNVANTQPYCHLHMPGCGVGGHCIPVYPYFIIKNVNASTELLKLARKINDGMALYTVNLVKAALNRSKMSLEGSNILVLGVVYRGGVKETRKSPAVEIIKILRKEGAGVYAFDPLLKDEVSRFGATPLNLDEAKDMDAVVIAADYKEFKEINWEELGRRMRRRVLVDGRQIVDPQKVMKAGFKFYGIGIKPSIQH